MGVFGERDWVVDPRKGAEDVVEVCRCERLDSFGVPVEPGGAGVVEEFLSQPLRLAEVVLLQLREDVVPPRVDDVWDGVMPHEVRVAELLSLPKLGGV